MPWYGGNRSLVSAPGQLRTHTYAGALARGLRVWSNVHQCTRTNKTPIIQAAEATAAKPRTQGEMNNKTPRTTESHSVIVAALRKASAKSARMTPITPMIHASQELAPFVAVPKTHGVIKRITPSTSETQSCQRVHAFMATTSLIPCDYQGYTEKHVGGHYLGLSVCARKLCSFNNLTEYSVHFHYITKMSPMSNSNVNSGGIHIKNHFYPSLWTCVTYAPCAKRLPDHEMLALSGRRGCDKRWSSPLCERRSDLHY